MTESNKSGAVHTISGNWRGNYFYVGKSDPHGFEAVFIEKEGLLAGNILDDGTLGEADVAGNFTYPTVNFTKRYRNKGLTPIHYAGEMSGDGNTISGTWSLKDKYGASWGTWIAYRFDAEDLFTLDTEEQTDFSVEEEKEKEKPLVAPSAK